MHSLPFRVSTWTFWSQSNGRIGSEPAEIHLLHIAIPEKKACLASSDPSTPPSYWLTSGRSFSRGCPFPEGRTRPKSISSAVATCNWLMVGISIQASLMSTISYLSVPGEQIKNGLMFHAAQLGTFPRDPGHQLSLAALLHAQAHHHRLRAAGAPFRPAGSAWSRWSFSWGFGIIWMGLVVYTASFALTRITGWELSTIIVAVALVGTIYTWMGGLRAVSADRRHPVVGAPRRQSLLHRLHHGPHLDRSVRLVGGGQARALRAPTAF